MDPSVYDSPPVVLRPLPSWARQLVWPLVFLSAASFVVALLAHVTAGIGQPVGREPILIGLGSVWVLLSAVLVPVRDFMAEGLRRRDVFRAAKAASPAWLRHFSTGCMIYGVVNFALLLIPMRGMTQHPGPEQPLTFVTGLAMVLFGIYFHTFTVAYRYTGEATKPKTDGMYSGA